MPGKSHRTASGWRPCKGRHTYRRYGHHRADILSGCEEWTETPSPFQGEDLLEDIPNHLQNIPSLPPVTLADFVRVDLCSQKRKQKAKLLNEVGGKQRKLPPREEPTNKFTKHSIPLELFPKKQDAELLRSRSDPGRLSSSVEDNKVAHPPLVRADSVDAAPPGCFEQSTSTGGCSTKDMVVEHVTRDFLPPSVVPSVIGPSPRASMMIKSESSQTAVLVLWNLSRIHVIPIVGCGSNGDQISKMLEEELETFLTNAFYAAAGTRLDGLCEYRKFLYLSHELVSQEKQLSELLGELVPAKPSSASPSAAKLLRGAFENLCVPVGKVHNKFDLVMSWWREESKEPITQKDRGHFSSARKCLVCFDDIEENDELAQFVPCGHWTCRECLHRYLRSAVRSGQGTVFCPAFKCTTKLGPLDSAHILLGNERKSDMARKQETFKKLFQFALYKHATCNAKCLYCPSRGCDRMLGPSDAGDVFSVPNLLPGCNFYLCSCGGSVCLDCRDGGDAHPGVRCHEFSNVRAEAASTGLAQELASIKWLLRNSKPCPKCRFPIHRYEGCNHVWCQRCSYYFCYMCGGYGNECNAYKCFKGGEYMILPKEYEESKYEKGFDTIDRLHGYQQSTAKLDSSRKTMACLGYTAEKPYSKYLEIEAQLRQAICWFRILAAAESLTPSPKSASQVEHKEPSPHLQHLELLNHASALRKILLTRRAHTKSTMDVDEVVALCVGTPPEKVLGTLRSQPNIMAPNDLVRLCKMTDRDFSNSAKAAIQLGIASLLRLEEAPDSPVPNPEDNSSRRRTEVAERLNEKQKPRKKWKKRTTQAIEKEATGNEERHEGQKTDRWKKSKVLVSSMRLLTLERKELGF